MDDLSTTHNPDVLPEPDAVIEQQVEPQAESLPDSLAESLPGPQADPDPLPEPQEASADPQSEIPVPAALPDPVPPKVKRKRSIPTPVLYSTLIIIGLIGGLGAGYAVQQHRKPTPLAPLAVTLPTYPTSPLFTGQLPVALPSTADDATITNGDLTKVLLPTPSGATADYDHVWLTLEDTASFCGDQASCFTNSLSNEMSRVADTSWTMANGDFAEIRIIQYAAGYSSSAMSVFDDTNSTGSNALALPSGVPISGYEYTDDSDQSLPTDYAVSVHGNLQISFWLTSANSTVPDPSIIDGLITQQLARL